MRGSRHRNTALSSFHFTPLEPASCAGACALKWSAIHGTDDPFSTSANHQFGKPPLLALRERPKNSLTYTNMQSPSPNMLWRKHPLHSPPRLTSSIPQMEQHLAALDTPQPDSPDDETDAYTTAAEYLQTPASSAQGQEAASSSASDGHIVSGSAEPQDTTMKLESGLPASPLKNVRL